jgi:hypothetical protein
MLAKMETNREMMDAKLDTHHERKMTRMDPKLEEIEAAVDVFEEVRRKWTPRISRLIEKS